MKLCTFTVNPIELLKLYCVSFNCTTATTTTTNKKQEKENQRMATSILHQENDGSSETSSNSENYNEEEVRRRRVFKNRSRSVNFLEILIFYYKFFLFVVFN